jgi:N-methylhydantoinase A
MSWRAAIDIGGAFTDLLAVNDATGDQIWIKIESTPSDYSTGVVEALGRSTLDLKKTSFLVHGQTVVINTIITRTGSKVGLITTDGFDILEIGRANRRDLFNMKYRKPEPLVPRDLKVRVKERIMAGGTIHVPLNEGEVRAAVKKLLGTGVEAFAVSFINSYANPAHEKRAGELVLDELERANRRPFITLSHELTREWREYERTSTAVLNSYVQPRFDAYLGKLEQGLGKERFQGILYIMLANAGMSTADFAKNYPIYTIEGGPVAGVVGALAIAEILGDKNIIVLDGGSTTTKASLVKDLLPKISTDYYVERDRFNPGHPVRVPVVEVVEIGSGGTSIAWIDDVGSLKVGPKATGADPGPACYGRGGQEPTLTDAYVVAGYLNPKYLLGGELKIKKDLAENALKKIAGHFSVSIEEAANAIIRIANDQAAHVIRLISVQKGYDPRDFTLIAHGGSGPMFAPFISSELQIPKIVVPAIPAGVFNAWGMLAADIRHDMVHTHIIKITDRDQASGVANKIYEELESQIFAVFSSEGVERDRVSIVRYADMRYYGQEHTIKVPLPSGTYRAEQVRDMEGRFVEAHLREYGFTLPGNAVELVSIHVVGISRVKKPPLRPLADGGRSMEKAYLGERDVYLGRSVGSRRIPIYKRELLPAEAVVKGPAIIEESTSTIVVSEDFVSKLDQYGNILIVHK